VSGAYVELGEDAREIALDGRRSDEERLGDFAVAESVCGVVGDAPLARR
jgi:hypothetical protein